MSDKALLQLSDYSNKYGISMSTLRRRIKAAEVEFEFDQGKYWLKDAPMSRYVRHRQQATDKKPVNQVEQDKGASKESDLNLTQPQSLEIQAALVDMREFTASAKSMMSEIKSAFIKALQEKEEQILELKDEVADLRTLNRILDQENERIKKNSFPEWIEDLKENEA